MVISFFNLEKNQEDIIKNKFMGYNLRFFSDSANKIDINQYIDSDIICICPKTCLDQQVLSQCKNLKCIIARSTGIDHINSEYCEKHNIQIKNAIKYGGITVAEYQFGIILNLTRKINQAQKRIQDGSFIKDGLQGIDLYGKTIGVIGYGNIGKNVVKIAKGFGMKVLVCTNTQSPKEEIEKGFKYVDLEKIFTDSDIISINIPANQTTYHLINKYAFDKMKESTILINTSRGTIINTNDLIMALENKKIAGAGLDVIEGEKFIKGDFMDIAEEKKENIISNLKKLLQFQNVIITPHNAYNTREAVDRIFEETIENIADYILKIS